MVVNRSKKTAEKSDTTPDAAEKIYSLTDFIEKITKYAERSSTLKCYRGQQDASWKSTPRLFRLQHKKLEENENRAIRDLIAVHPQEFSTDQSMFDRLVRMQHFGLPTRLLDVSLNPLVALYFATESDLGDNGSDGLVSAFAIPEEREKYFDSDSVSCIANLANLTKKEKNQIIDLHTDKEPGENYSDKIKRLNVNFSYRRLYKFIKEDKSYFLNKIKPEDLFKPYYVHPKMSNPRISAQNGGFIIHGLSSKKDINFKHEIKESKFIIPKDYKNTLRKSLKLLGITESVLFPEIDKAAKRITENYLQC